MAIKISNLPDATLPLGSNSKIPLVQNGVTVKASISSLSAGGGGGSVDTTSLAKLSSNNFFVGGNTFLGGLTATESTTFRVGNNTVTIFIRSDGGDVSNASIYLDAPANTPQLSTFNKFAMTDWDGGAIAGSGPYINDFDAATGRPFPNFLPPVPLGSLYWDLSGFIRKRLI